MRPGITGLQIPAYDYLALSDAIKSLFLDEKFRNDLGDAAYQFISEKYSSELITKYWIEFYKSLL
jgi:glycosyltransferase involved in cell wall biosynthesis